MNAVGKSVTGLIRKNNEDKVFISESKKKYYIAADGMGGQNGGEIASGKAIAVFNEVLASNDYEYYKENVLDVLVEGIMKANKEIFKLSKESEDLEGMGTTFTCAAIENGKMYVIHVGDSRCYIYRKGELKQLTKDHSFVMEMVKQGKLSEEEAKTHPKRNLITRAVGTEDTLNVDAFIEKIEDGDIIMLCTDGLTSMVCDEDIKGILSEEGKTEEMLEKLIEKAEENGGRDNISVVVIDLR